jgi:hypothetical protein
MSLLPETRHTRRRTASILNPPSDTSRTTAGVIFEPIDEIDFTKLTASSEADDDTAIDIQSPEYWRSLASYNISVNYESPPEELEHRALRIISRPRPAAELTDIMGNIIVDTARRMKVEQAPGVARLFAQAMIPTMEAFTEPRLAQTRNKKWLNCAPVPANSSLEGDQLPLPKPRPAFVF